MNSAAFLHPTLAFIALGLLLPFLPSGAGRWWRWLLPIPAALAIWSVFTVVPANYGGLTWMGFDLTLGRVDKLSLVFANVFAVQALIGFIYALHVDDKRQHIAACFYVGGAFGCIFAGDYLTLFGFWEMMSVASTMLIWLNFRDNKLAMGAGFRYFLVHTFGGLLLLAGMLLRHKATGSWAFTAVPFDTAHYYDWLIMLGFGVNAALIGLHAWLPDAYPEATITGAVFMSAFTTKTAVYTLARAFAGWDFLAIMGVVMTLYGVIFASMENNARRILSYHIVSQVGYMVAGIGIGTAMTIDGACAHAYAHILYKGLLFMSVGAVLYATGTQKLTELGGLAGKLPLVTLCYIVAGLSISGWPLFNGFVSKTMTIAGAFADHRLLLGLGMELSAVGTFLSVGIKLPYYAFFYKSAETPREVRPIPWNMTLAMCIGASLCFLQGIYPELLYRLLPYPVDFQPWQTWNVLQSLLLLTFSGLAFYLLRASMKPHAQRNIDFDAIYRLLGRAVVAFISWPLAALDGVWTEVYAKLGLRGLMGGASAARVFDVSGIDTVVDGTAYSTQAVAGQTAKTQSGRLQDYLGGALIAAAVVFALVWGLNK